MTENDHAVRLSKDGIFTFSWDETQGRWVPERCEPDKIFVQLRKACHIAPGTTLLDIFNVVDQYPLLKMFMSQYSWCYGLELFHEQARLPRTDDKHYSQMTHLEIAKFADVVSNTERIRHPGGLRERIITINHEEPWLDFIGVGPHEATDYEPAPEGTCRYSVSYSPMNEIAHLEVKLVEKMELYAPYDVRKNMEDNNKPILIKDVDFTLQDVLDAIYWDISWHGTPAGNAAFICDLNEKVDEIKSGEVAAIPLQQLENHLGLDPTPEGGFDIVLHPDAVRSLGVDPATIQE